MTTDERVRLLEIIVDDLDDLARHTDERLDTIERTIWRGIGVLSGAVLVGNILAPFIFQALNR